jgi:hypothetical protein
MMEFGSKAFASRETSSLACSRRAVVIFHADDQMSEEEGEKAEWCCRYLTHGKVASM